MTSQIADLFDAFLQRITPSDSEKAMTLERGQRLSQELEQRPEVRNCLITGSMVRSTAIREFSDVDIMAVIEPGDQLAQVGPAALVAAVASILRDTELHVQISENAVRVMYPDSIAVDVLGGIHAGTNSRDDDVYLIPSASQERWETYVPEEQNRRIREATDSLGCDFKNVIRLCKWWSKIHGQPVSSYEIEAAARDSFSTAMPELPIAIIELFKSIESSADMSPTGLLILLKSRETAEAAYASWRTGDVEKSSKLWGRLFGEQRPGVIA
jgi:predicted nucleotidyltransferase